MAEEKRRGKKEFNIEMMSDLTYLPKVPTNRFYKAYDPAEIAINLEHDIKIIETCFISLNHELDIILKFEELGYTNSVWKFCSDAIKEKVQRSMNDHEKLGRLISEKIRTEIDYWPLKGDV